MRSGNVLLLVVTALALMAGSLLAPRSAAASVEFVNQWQQTPQIISNGSATTVSGKFSPGIGSNRLMLVAVAAELSSVAAPTFTVTYGGKSVTQIVVSNNTTSTIWLGYLNEAGIAGANDKTLTVTKGGTGTLTGMYATCAVVNGVNQTTPITGSNTNSTASGTSLNLTIPLTNNAGLTGNNGLLLFVSNWDGQTSSVSSGYTEMSDYAGSVMNVAAGYKVTAGTGTEGPVSTAGGTTAGAFAGIGINPALKLATNTTCGDCHSNPPQNGTSRGTPPGLFAGKHEKHTGGNDYQYSQVCTVCHRTFTGYTNTTGFKHANGRIRVAGSSVSNTAYSLTSSVAVRNNPTFGTCSNVSCHATGRTPAKYSTSPDWGTAGTCLSCHGGRVNTTGVYAKAASGYGLSTTHVHHLKYPAANVNCNSCHSRTTTLDASNNVVLRQYSGVALHNQGTATVGFRDLNYGSYTAYKSATKKCLNISCHGGTTRSGWSDSGSLNTDNTCTHCHGQPSGVGTGNTNLKLYAPGWGTGATKGTSTDQYTSAKNMRVGAHFGHLSSAFAKQIKCNECHRVPTTPFDSGGTHMTGPRFNSQTVTFAQASTANKNSAPLSVTPGTAVAPATCNTTYCHGGAMPGGDTTGLSKSPAWNNDAYLTQTLSVSGSCNNCHGFPPTTASGHPSATTPASFPTSNCSCHANMNSAGTTYANIFFNKNLHINGIFESAGSGHVYGYGGNKHSAAAGLPMYTSCTTCHNNMSAGGSYPVTRGNAALITCGNCHINYTNFTGSTPGCYDCHGKSRSGLVAGNYTGARPTGATFPNWSGSHQSHVITNAYLCSDCHSGGGTGTAAHGNYSGILKARNSTSIKMAFNTAKSGTAATVNWSGSTVTSCNTSFCHGQKSPQWGLKPSTYQCTHCHGQANTNYTTAALGSYSSAIIAPGGAGKDTGGNTANTSARVGMHQEHLTNASALIGTNVKCRECHVVVTTVGATSHLNYTTATVTFDGRAVARSHTAASVTRTSGVITCNNTYCHSGAQDSGSNMAPKWNETAYLSSNTLNSMTLTGDCTKCHGLPPAAHGLSAVTALSGFSACTGCHSGLNGSPATNSAIFTDWTKHMNGSGDAVGATKCNGCHSYDAGDWATATHNYGGTPGKEGIGAHAKHITFLKMQLNITLDPTADYTAGFGAGNAGALCGVCHSNDSVTDHSTATPTNPRSITFGGSPKNQTYQFGGVLPVYNGQYNTSSSANAKTCQNLSCHYFTTPIWSTY